jgi:hypothetical protein
VAFLIVASTLSACGGSGGGGGGTVPVTGFTTWRTDVAGKTIQVNGDGKQVSYTYDLASQSIKTISDPLDGAASALFSFDNASVLTGLLLTSAATTVGSFGAGDIGILAADPDSDFVIAENFSSRAIISNPRSLAWDYQSFGVWETGLNVDSGSYGAMSLGAPTAGTAIPGSGTANFSGKVVGSYVNDLGKGHTVLANLNVGVDWGNQSLNLSISGTRMSADGVTFSPNTSLDMSNQTLSYTAGTNGFSGTLSTGGLSGNSSGKFYGPNAEELGGVFFLQGSGLETYSGAYGAKR